MSKNPTAAHIDKLNARIKALETALRAAIYELRWHDAVGAADRASAALAGSQE
jgi:hypothetical protein